MNKKVIAAIGVIALGSIGMLIWAWRSGDFALVITMAVALVLICSVGVMPVVFNAQGRTRKTSKSYSITVVKDERDTE